MRFLFLLGMITTAAVVASTSGSSDANRILEYYHGRGAGKYLTDPQWVESVVITTEHYALKFGVNVHGQVILAGDIAESGLDPKSLNKKEGSYGITQVSPPALPFLYAELRKVEPIIPPMNEILRYPDYQIALGVLAFKFKLRDAHGDPWEAIRRYNGGGAASYVHQAKVRLIYDNVFKRIGHVGHSAARPTRARKGEPMLKRMFLAMSLLLAPVTHVVAVEAPEAQAVVASEVSTTAGADILRDVDLSSYPCYGCPGDKSMTDGIPKKVKAQQAIYTAARDAYKNSWALADVQHASDYAFRTDVAAWPWVNLAHHIWLESGDPDAGDKALDKAEALIKGHKAPDVEKMIASNRNGLKELRKTLAKHKK